MSIWHFFQKHFANFINPKLLNVSVRLWKQWHECEQNKLLLKQNLTLSSHLQSYNHQFLVPVSWCHILLRTHCIYHLGRKTNKNRFTGGKKSVLSLTGNQQKWIQILKGVPLYFLQLPLLHNVAVWAWKKFAKHKVHSKGSYSLY